ncbi:3-methyl-2-oxobutanoate hydroxymethyltransferase [Leptolyngbya boryana NIES-2135]|jgi:3-methyl-2-oxobutanoate hydroxymethyltransferase|uniref:3-methyl-2-oxobutanoate hydroxymethyltransferase n=1 Tax=Leptolyngbya boryana NIES-2135 TaxID=1973484 RepID=A0A1Z4J9A5_LEPBY|nr:MULTISPECIES: 3-methyl-2-oxobutanoate hydroxymethyltransferase [Leptolyngbya]BAY53349.1 3-methyl-2-oxobutanoate hydroxymethyltransferase [Leptolyngbya boryana NIES-2135]MBD1855122.1 3-methyl-2-oxobutanoate hydroxymethyltransferase [Leptolyngbya sp. FACHB-1624]MBD2366786.1 3-methyl-2-oxobutanoate hydroxymethyltransferase [Leptolyngbya sp. FACHB-161]MBD2373199.1 3-methyl-2-oxobutanoate hydroxymethyltransferase [Leptolyngbya sp. FACHB-238]MBD2397600.1 3-methyl-2-oxobutanoate hydroxymethyltrans
MLITPQHLIQWKQQNRAIAVLTAWDYAIASILDRAGIEVILVGDSLSMVALGHETTLPLTLDEVIHHAKAVRRGVKEALLVVDLPFLTYQESWQQAMHSAGRILKETNAGAVKLEGGYPAIAETVARLVQAGIPVMGHVGLTPQSVRQTGFRQQGKSHEAGEKIVAEAIALEQAGAFAVVIEHVPADLAKTITESLTIPTIGIGAGIHCDGQVLVTSDVLGLGTWKPKFAKTYLDLNALITQAVQEFGEEVRAHKFPPET